MMEISISAIRKLGRKGGAFNISAKMYPQIRESVEQYLTEILYTALAFLGERRTVSTKFVTAALEKKGIFLGAIDLKTGHVASGTHDPKPRKPTTPKKRVAKPGVVAVRTATQLQESDGFTISRAPFARLVKGLVKENAGVELKFSAGALEALQMVTENFIIAQFQDAVLAAGHSNRVRVMTKDTALTERVKCVARGSGCRLRK